jgi:hypothetical protein
MAHLLKVLIVLSFTVSVVSAQSNPPSKQDADLYALARTE